jgi:hypothetical protein
LKSTEAKLPAIRRSQRSLSAKDFLAEARGLSLEWPGKTVRLERNSLHDHWQQPASSQPAIAELYHENSKLFPGLARELLASRTDVLELRKTVATQRSDALRDGGSPKVELPPQAGRLLDTALSGLPEAAFFAFDLRVAAGTTLAVFDPLRKAAYGLKTIAPEDLAATHAALALIGQRSAPEPDGMLIFLVASFARNQMLYGPRGYRRTLIEGGQLVEHMLSHAAASGHQARLWLEFADRRIDDFVQADGLEEATIAVLEMRCSEDADDS